MIIDGGVGRQGPIDCWINGGGGVGLGWDMRGMLEGNFENGSKNLGYERHLSSGPWAQPKLEVLSAIGVWRRSDLGEDG